MSSIINIVSEETYSQKMSDYNLGLQAFVASQYVTKIGDYTWMQIQKLVRLGIAEQLFPIGAQLLLLKNGTNYAYDVIAHNYYRPAESGLSHSMSLLAHDVYTKNVSIDHTESSNPDSNRKADGNNNWKVSNLRQWLNSEAAANSWYSAQHTYDSPPGYTFTNTAGFLNGLDSELKSVMGAVYYTSAIPTIDGGGSEQLSDKVFIPARSEVGLGNTESNVSEGDILPYFKGHPERRYRYLNGAAAHWFLRTPKTDTSHRSCLVTQSNLLTDIKAREFGNIGLVPMLHIV